MGRLAHVNRSQGDSLPEHRAHPKSSEPALVASPAMVHHDSGWSEVGAGVFTRREGALDVAVTVVVGPSGVVVVDCLADPRAGAALATDLAALSDGPLAAVVCTHAHYDHTFGAAGLLAHPRTGAGRATLVAHAGLRAHVRAFEEPELAAGRRGDLALAVEGLWDDVVLPVLDVEVETHRSLELGGRTVELWPLAPAHTTCDLLVHVPDAGVWVVGDVVEESGPPSFEPDSDPHGWALALERLVARLGPGDVVVPGHGAPVDREFVTRQAAQVRAVADVLRDAHDAGLAQHAAVPLLRAATGWPAGTLRAAAAAGFARLTEQGEPGGPGGLEP